MVADWISRRNQKAVQWQCRASTKSDATSSVFDGTPYIVVGRQILECISGQPRKKTACSTVSKVIIHHFFSVKSQFTT